MEYFNEILDRKTGTLSRVSQGDWITITELGDLYDMGKREVRDILRRLEVLVVEGAERHRRHRLARWVVERGWGRRIEAKGTHPFDVVGPELRQWLSSRWQQALQDKAREATASTVEAARALAHFNGNRLNGDLTVQQSVSWLIDHFPHLTQCEMGLILNVTQQMIAKWMNVRSAQIRDAKALKAMDLDERKALRSSLHADAPLSFWQKE
ncbi:hypothetical protein [Mesorhizobium sp. CAU 1741]|uniref:hypothetical protein n=1 Tax=Mesorhizobium sp. CAU 1741 TaxID=3140366 RepID=UPI00325B00B2